MRCLMLLFFCMAILSSCMQDTLLHVYQPVPATGWSCRDTLCFEVDSSIAAGSYSLTVGIRTVPQPSLSQVVIAVEQHLDSPLYTRTDTLVCTLTDAEGRPNVRGGNNPIYENVQLPFHLTEGQHGTIRIRHLMRREVVQGITDVGIRIGR